MALLVAGVVGLPVFNSVRCSIMDLYKDYGNLFSYGLKELMDFITFSDIEARIKTLNSAMDELYPIYSQSPLRNTISLIVKDIDSIINEINTELIETKRRVLWNKSNWFRRSYRFYNTLTRIKNKVLILNEREKRLYENLNIVNLR